MKILNDGLSKSLILNQQTKFRLDLGWEENMQEYENDTLANIINPIENFETVRYIHDPYISSNSITQSDIWFMFYFYNTGLTPTHDGGLNYQYAGISPQDNELFLPDATNSFFRLEFYKIPSGETPNRINRKLAFTKNLSIPFGEKIFYTPINDYIHVPIFTGSNYRNKENMYLFWFQDDTVVSGTTMSGNTFYVTARFFNALDGSISNFSNKSIIDPAYQINEDTDMYYEMVIDRTIYSYQMYEFSGSTGNRIGMSGNPIIFYEVNGG